MSSSRLWTWSAVLAITVITVLHYLTHSDIGNVDSHTLFRRFYYVPIAILAVLHGAKGGGISSLAVVLFYLPHALMTGSGSFFGIHVHADPAPVVEKISEMVLYVSLGLSVGVAVDRERKAQVELLMATQQLERTERLSALGRLVAGVAHEIRNPLASLHATAEMFLDDYDAEHKKRRMVELNFEEVKRLENVVERFLTYAKPGVPRREKIELGPLLEKVKDLVSSTARGKNVEVICEIFAEKPVVVDPDQILQVILNLALNAIDASEDGQHIRLSLSASEEDVIVDVEDHGPGVPKEIQKSIFEPFFTTRAQGTGLGLSVGSQIIQAHGGTLRYEDNRDEESVKGALFRIRLPRRMSTPPQMSTENIGVA